MTLDNAILGFLAWEPMTGYDLKTKCFGRSARHIWPADQAQVYRTLDRLVQRRQISVRLVPQRGRPDRKVYSITAAGRAQLRDWLGRPHELPQARDPFLLQVFFSADLPDSAIRGLLGEARAAYQQRLQRLRTSDIADLDEWVASTGRARDGALRRMTLVASMQAYRAAIDWVDDCLAQVEAGLPVLQTSLDSLADGLGGTA